MTAHPPAEPRAESARSVEEIARELAVAIVDQARGYTMEFAPSPSEHRHVWTLAEERIAAALQAERARAQAAEKRAEAAEAKLRELLAPERPGPSCEPHGRINCGTCAIESMRRAALDVPGHEANKAPGRKCAFIDCKKPDHESEASVECKCEPCPECGFKHYCNLSIDHTGPIRTGECLTAAPGHQGEEGNG